jgi:diaminohydroxyphosphoribosylaminopyrimidine deaminase/5-amino-6-(5-phosphoribosylamino)uracil reductase
MVNKDAEKYLKMTLELAAKGRGATSPNPMVGAVIVKNGRIVGQGYHKCAGGPHAEIVAINEAREKASGATLYVNLEPCCHYGRTSPCTQAIVDAGIKEVIFAMKDPNPKVNGKGMAILKKSGIRVSYGLLEEESRYLNEAYIKYIKTDIPFVILKMAQSLDGRIATSIGDSHWISCREARKFAHQLRTESDAVVVGKGTVNADNPKLNVRLVKGKNPYRIILSRQADFSPNLNLFKHNNDARTILATSKSSAGKLKAKNLIIWEIKENKKGLILDDFLRRAGQFGIQTLLIEGGSRLATSFLRQRLVDKIHLMIAPMIIGKGKESVDELNIKKLRNAIKFDSYIYHPCGSDILFTGYPERK